MLNVKQRGFVASYTYGITTKQEAALIKGGQKRLWLEAENPKAEYTFSLEQVHESKHWFAFYAHLLGKVLKWNAANWAGVVGGPRRVRLSSAGAAQQLAYRKWIAAIAEWRHNFKFKLSGKQRYAFFQNSHVKLLLKYGGNKQQIGYTHRLQLKNQILVSGWQQSSAPKLLKLPDCWAVRCMQLSVASVAPVVGLLSSKAASLFILSHITCRFSPAAFSSLLRRLVSRSPKGVQKRGTAWNNIRQKFSRFWFFLTCA